MLSILKNGLPLFSLPRSKADHIIPLRFKPSNGYFPDHIVKFFFHFRLEVCLNLIDFCKFGKCPAAILTIIVDAGNPVGATEYRKKQILCQ